MTRQKQIEYVGRAIAEADQEDYMEDCKRYDERAKAAIKAVKTIIDNGEEL